MRRSMTPDTTDELSALDSKLWDVRERASKTLFAKGSDAIDLLVAGVSHRRLRVRAGCVALLDHLADDRCHAALLAALHDTSPLVRRHAVHAIGCQQCKASPLRIDVTGALIDRMTNDPSPRVRRVAAHQLGLQPYDSRALTALAQVASERRDPGLLSRARHALAEQQRRALRPAVQQEPEPAAPPGSLETHDSPPAMGGLG